MARVYESEVAAVIGDICSDIARGKIPYVLIARFRNDPWRHLEPFEVLETRFGELIPKDVVETSVRVAQNPDDGSSVTIGVHLDGTFWSSASRIPNVPLDMKRANGPFFPSIGSPQLIIAADGSVRSIHGGRVADKVLSDSPFIAHSSYDRGIIGYEHETSASSRCWLNRLFGEPVGAIFMNGTFAVWNKHGTVYVAEDTGSPGLEYCFPFIPGQTVESVAKCSALVAIVFRFTGEKPSSKLVVLQHGKIVVQTTEEHNSISAPVIMQNGTLFVRIDGTLMRLSPGGKSLEKVLVDVTGNPWLTNNDVLIVTQKGFTLRIYPNGKQDVLMHDMEFVGGSFIGIRTPSDALEIAKVLDDGRLIKGIEFRGVRQKGFHFLAKEHGYAISYVLSPGGSRQVFSTVRYHGEGDGYSESSTINVPEGCIFDLHQVVTRGTSVYAVMQKPGGGKDWCVVMNGEKGTAIQLGKAGHAIFGLAHWGPLLQWYRREGREIFLCRMYVGE